MRASHNNGMYYVCCRLWVMDAQMQMIVSTCWPWEADIKTDNELWKQTNFSFETHSLLKYQQLALRFPSAFKLCILKDSTNYRYQSL